MTYLTEKHYDCMLLLLKGVPVAKAAEELGVSAKTIYNWLAKPDFTLEMNKLNDS